MFTSGKSTNTDIKYEGLPWVKKGAPRWWAEEKYLPKCKTNADSVLLNSLTGKALEDRFDGPNDPLPLLRGEVSRDSLMFTLQDWQATSKR